MPVRKKKPGSRVNVLDLPINQVWIQTRVEQTESPLWQDIHDFVQLVKDDEFDDSSTVGEFIEEQDFATGVELRVYWSNQGSMQLTYIDIREPPEPKNQIVVR